MEQNILISVVIPTYSRNTTLRNAINSVLAQTYQNYEILVVDDNPSDSEWRISTQKLMAEYADNNKIRYIQNAKNLGGSGARNEGIKAAKGEYIAFLDDDDEYLPERLEKQLECFLTTDLKKLALVFCDAVMTYDNDKFICYVKPRYRGCCLYEAMRDNCLAATSQWMAKKSALLDVGMFTVVPCKQDSTLILKLLAEGYEVDCVSEVLSKFCNYLGQNRISWMGKKNLEGELLYRERCRALYDKLSTDQINNVEFAFGSRLFQIYSNLGMKDEASNELKCIKKIDIKMTYKFLFKRRLSNIKSKIKNIFR